MPIPSQGQEGREEFGRGNNGTCYAQDGQAYDGREQLPGLGSQQERNDAAATAQALDGTAAGERYKARVAAYDQQHESQGEWSLTRQDYDLGRLTD